VALDSHEVIEDIHVAAEAASPVIAAAAYVDLACGDGSCFLELERLV
jgi:hypothetical protein